MPHVLLDKNLKMIIWVVKPVVLVRTALIMESKGLVQRVR